MSQQDNNAFLMSVAKNVNAAEAEREEAIHALAIVGNQTHLNELMELHKQPGTPNFKLVLMRAISAMTVRLSDLEKGI